SSPRAARAPGPRGRGLRRGGCGRGGASVEREADGVLAHPGLVDLDAETGPLGQFDAAAAFPDALLEERRLDVLRPVELQRVDVEGGGEMQPGGEAEIGLGESGEGEAEPGRLGDLAELA